MNGFANAIGARAARAAYGVKDWVASRPAAVQQAVTSPDWWKNLGQSVATGAVGQPRQFFKQVAEGTAHQPGGMLRQAVRPNGTFDALTMYGLPALSILSAAQAPSHMRGSSIGNIVGSTAGGILGAPLGMAGRIGGSVLLGNLGSTVGSLFDQKSVPEDQGQNPSTQGFGV